MARWLIVFLTLAACWLGEPACAWAQGAGGWPTYQAPFSRGPGFYLSLWKLFACWALVAAWVWTGDWVSQDCLGLKFDYMLWNSVVFGTFVVAFVLLWLIPLFAVGYVLLLVAYIAPLTTYIVYRNRKVESNERVLTRDHARHIVARSLGKVGVKVDETGKPKQEGPDVQLAAKGGDDRQNRGNELLSRQSPGHLLARELIADALAHRADGVTLNYGMQGVGVRYQIEGVWHDYAPQERANGDMVLAVLKTLSALKPEDRRSRQTGTFGVTAMGISFDCKLATQGTQSGEVAVLQLNSRVLNFKSLDELGMRAKMQEHLLEILNQKNGFLLFSSLPGNGLTTTLDVVLDSTDRYVRNFVAIEDADRPEREILNVPVTTFKSTAGETPAAVLPNLIRTYPDVIVVRELADPETVRIMCEQSTQDRLMIGGIRAKEAIEALLRVLLLKVPPAEFASAVTAVVNQRLVRKLCEKCKEGYAPPQEVLKQFGLPPGRIEAFYRPPTVQAEPDKICQNCLGIGYRDRTAIFELLLVDDRMRQILATQPKLDLLREAARQARHRSLQEEGLLLVARGITSISELLRVLKQ